MTHPHRGSSKFGRNTRVDIRVISDVRTQRIRPEHQGNEIAIGDELDFRAHNGSCTEKNVTLIQAWITISQSVCPKIMFAHKERLERGQSGVLIGAHVTGQKEGGAGIRLVRETIHVERQQIIVACLQMARPSRVRNSWEIWFPQP